MAERSSAARRAAKAVLPRSVQDWLYLKFVTAPGRGRAGLQQSAAPAAPGRCRVVVLTDIPFWESAYGSHLRLQSLFGALAAETDLTVFCFKSVGAGAREKLDRIGADYRVVSYKSHERKEKKPADPGPVGRDPALRGRVVDSWVHSTRDFLAQDPPDAVIVEYIDRSYLLDAVPGGTARLLDMHDVMSSRIGVFARFGQSTSIQMSARDEARIMAHYDALIAISPADAADITARLGQRKVLTVPHAVAPRPLCVPGRPARRLLFAGANSVPNAEGLRWFLDQVWPVVSDRFDLTVVGSVCDVAPRGRPNVTLLGRVEDLDAVLAETDIAINPVFIGGGLKIKTVDALAAGLPSVNCSEAVRGIEHLSGAALAVADSRAAFIAELLDLQRDEGRRRDMSQAALDAVTAEFAPGRVFRALLDFLSRTRRAS